MEGVLITLGFFIAVVLIVYFVVSRRHEEHMALIGQRKMPFIYPAPSSMMGSITLCWGLILIALGLAAIIFFMIEGEITDEPSLFSMLITFLCGGALLLYHKLTAGQREWGRKLYEKKISAISGKVENSNSQ